MTPEECSRMVTDITSTWPSGVRGHVWSDVLAPLRYDVARATYLALRTREHHLSVARFTTEYERRVAARRREAQARQPTLPEHEELGVDPSDARILAIVERERAIGRDQLYRISGGRLGAPLGDHGSEST